MYTKSICCLLLTLLFLAPCSARAKRIVTERLALQLIEAGQGVENSSDRRCLASSHYVVYLIDNFDQEVETIPEIRTSHGELVQKMLTSGRHDIRIRRLNTSLVKGLAEVILDLSTGGCADAVLSAIPGSNYSYDQVSTLLDGARQLRADNILEHRRELRDRMLEIARAGFPSVEWLKKLDANPVKVREDAYKLAFLSELSRLSVPVYLPYGNRDATHRGMKRDVNLLALVEGVRVFSGEDHSAGVGQHGYPYSPLSSGRGVSTFRLLECPDPESGPDAYLDIDEDGFSDYHYRRRDLVAFVDEAGSRGYAPPPVSDKEYEVEMKRSCPYDCLKPGTDLVLSPVQYRVLVEKYENGDLPDLDLSSEALVRVERNEKVTVKPILPVCRLRGSLSGTSFVVPTTLKRDLQPKNTG